MVTCTCIPLPDHLISCHNNLYCTYIIQLNGEVSGCGHDIEFFATEVAVYKMNKIVNIHV